MIVDLTEFKSKILEEIFQSYTRLGFGRLLKSEIDLIMFDFALKMIISKNKPEYFIGSEINYFAVNKEDIFELSRELKIKDTKINDYIEQIGLLKGLLGDHVGLDNFKKLLKSQFQKKENTEKGLLSVQITNKLLRNFVETKIVKIGGQIQYDSNKEIILFDLVVLMEFFKCDSSSLGRWAKEQNDLFNDEEIKDLKTKLNKINLSKSEITLDISKTILKKFIGKSGDVIMEKAFELIGNAD